jgi:uncharacterized protein (TIGR03000 family)
MPLTERTDDMCKQPAWMRGLPALAVLTLLCVWDRAGAQYSYQPANRYPFVSSLDAPNTYGGYTQGPGFFYTGGVAPANAPEEQVAYIHVRVSPPHAEISFEGSKTTQIGTSRLYVSPPLNQGQNYEYDIRVSWNDNGRVVTQDRKVFVRAGDRLSVVFREPANNSGTSAPVSK